MTDTYRAHRLLYRTLPPIILAVLWVSTGVEIGHALTNIREETSEFVSSVLLLVITLMFIKRYNNKNTARPRSSERSLLAAMFPIVGVVIVIAVTAETRFVWGVVVGLALFGMGIFIHKRSLKPSGQTSLPRQ